MAGTLVVEPTKSGADQPGAPERFDAVQGLRALAALAVFFIHVSETRYAGFGYVAVGVDRYVRSFFDELVVGVPIFFAISGFVLYRPFVARHAAGAPEPSTGSYLVRRVLRIYPAYWAALVITVVAFGNEIVLRGTGRWIANLTLVQMYVSGARGYGNVFMGMIQAWTLTAEITFYVSLPVFAFLVRRATRNRDPFVAHWSGVVAVMLGGVGARLWLIAGAPPTWVTVLPAYLPFFATGMALAVVSVRAARTGAVPSAVDWCSRHPAVCAVMAFAAFLGSSVISYVQNGEVINPLRSAPVWEGAAKFCLQWIVVVGLLVPAVVGIARGGRVRSTLSARVPVFLGSISYGIYLWHYAIIRWLGDHWFGAKSGQTMVKVTVVALPATIAVAYLSYIVVEKPAIRLSKRVR